MQSRTRNNILGQARRQAVGGVCVCLCVRAWVRQQRGACVCNRSGSGVSRCFGYVNRRRLRSCDYRDRNGPEWQPFAVVGAGVLLWDMWMSNGQMVQMARMVPMKQLGLSLQLAFAHSAHGESAASGCECSQLTLICTYWTLTILARSALLDYYYMNAARGHANVLPSWTVVDSGVRVAHAQSPKVFQCLPSRWGHASATGRGGDRISELLG